MLLFSNGECLNLEFVCDGYKHCADGSDEDEKKCKVRNSIWKEWNKAGSEGRDIGLFITLVLKVL